MDFFSSQDVARRNTFKLVVLFLLAVVSLIAITNVLVLFTMGMVAEDPAVSLAERIDWRLFAWVGAAVIAVIAFGSLYKMASLSGGGARVAEMMQAKLIVDGSGDPGKQRVLNVVEEMAIAAGTPVPPVYLMEEEAINAFAAGTSPSNAVIGITRGAIDKLSRDELQGVIAHEFSHILHGDMRLNIRLIGILHGIMVLGLMGYFLMRSAAFSRRSRGGGNIVFLGLGLVVIGFAGTFFGNLIKAAVSRQREYLADASAVQYTRNPGGIAGALKRIGSDAKGAVLDNPGASEISHALFGEGVRSSFSKLFATHPPLEKRVRAIQPDWDGEFTGSESDAQQTGPEVAGEDQGAAPSSHKALGLAALAGEALTQAGNPQTGHLQYARELHARLPEKFLRAAHDPCAARALIYMLASGSEEATRDRQLEYLRRHADKGVYEEVRALEAEQAALEPEFRLPLINIALSGLRQMSPRQHRLFRQNLGEMLEQDPGRGLRQWVVYRIVCHQLDDVFRDRPRLRGKPVSLEQSRQSVGLLLSWLVGSGEQHGVQPEEAFNAAGQVLQLSGLSMTPAAALSLAGLDEAAGRLGRLRPGDKPRLLKACMACIAADGRASVAERELFRAVAEILDCPMPPLLDPAE